MLTSHNSHKNTYRFICTQKQLQAILPSHITLFVHNEVANEIVTADQAYQPN